MLLVVVEDEEEEAKAEQTSNLHMGHVECIFERIRRNLMGDQSTSRSHLSMQETWKK